MKKIIAKEKEIVLDPLKELSTNFEGIRDVLNALEIKLNISDSRLTNLLDTAIKLCNSEIGDLRIIFIAHCVRELIEKVPMLYIEQSAFVPKSTIDLIYWEIPDYIIDKMKKDTRVKEISAKKIVWEGFLSGDNIANLMQSIDISTNRLDYLELQDVLYSIRKTCGNDETSLRKFGWQKFLETVGPEYGITSDSIDDLCDVLQRKYKLMSKITHSGNIADKITEIVNTLELFETFRVKINEKLLNIENIMNE